TGLLRYEMGFDGLVVTDLMSMQAIAARWSVEESTVLSVLAGADIVMASGPTEKTIRAIEAIVRAVEDGTIPMERIDGAVDRIMAARDRLGLWDEPPIDAATGAGRVGTPDHLAVVDDLAARSI